MTNLLEKFWPSLVAGFVAIIIGVWLGGIDYRRTIKELEIHLAFNRQIVTEYEQLQKTIPQTAIRYFAAGVICGGVAWRDKPDFDADGNFNRAAIYWSQIQSNDPYIHPNK